MDRSHNVSATTVHHMWGHNRNICRNHPLISFARILLHSRSFVEQNSKRDTLRTVPPPLLVLSREPWRWLQWCLHKFPTAAKLVQFSLEELHAIHHCQARSHSNPFKSKAALSYSPLTISLQCTAVQPPRKSFKHTKLTQSPSLQKIFQWKHSIKLFHVLFFSQCQCSYFGLNALISESTR